MAAHTDAGVPADPSTRANHPPGKNGSPASGRPGVHDECPPIPDHEVIRCIGSGAYGNVWLARNVMGVFRAVKVVHRDSFDTDRPFEREFQGIQRFEPISRSHESQVNILQVGRGDGYFYYVMELADDASTERDCSPADPSTPMVPSRVPPRQASILDPAKYAPRTIKSELRQRGHLPFAECLDIGISLTTALAHLHKHGLVHRDIKPSNIIFVNSIPKLADIGLVTRNDVTGSFVGTEGFIPPEGPGTAQADLFALGKVLYEMSTGKDRHDFPEPATKLGEFADREQLLELDEIIQQACAREVSKRYQTAEDMEAALLLLKTGNSVRRARMVERRLALMTRMFAIFAAVVVLGLVPYYLAIRGAYRVRVAEADAKEKLRDSYLAQAQAGRYSHRPGRRFVGLELVKKAKSIRTGLDLRNEAIACLALPDLREVKEFGDPNAPYAFVDFDLDRRRYARRDTNGDIRIRSVDNGQELTCLPGFGAEASQELRFSPDGRFLAAYCGLAGGPQSDKLRELRVWNIGQVKPILSLTNNFFRTPAFSPDSRTVVLAVGLKDLLGRLDFYDLETGRNTISTIVWDQLGCFCFSPDGKKLALATGGPYIRLFDPTSAMLPHRLTNSIGICTLAWHPNSRWLAAGGEDGRVFLWDVADRRLKTVFTGHQDRVINSKFTQDGAWLASAAWDGTFRLWNVLSGEQSLASRIFDTTFSSSSDNQWWGHVIGAGPRLGLWQLTTAPEMQELYEGTDSRFGPTRSAFAPGGQVLAVGLKSGIKLWNLKRKAEVAFLPVGDAPDLAFEPGGGLLAGTGTGLQRWPVRCDAAGEAIQLGSPETLSASGAVMQITCSQQNCVAYLQGGNVHLFNLATRQDTRVLEAPFPFARVTISPDGKLVTAWGYPASEFQVRATATGEMVRSFSGKGVGFALFSPDGRSLAIGDQSGYECWDIAAWKSRFSRRTQAGLGVREFAFSPDSRILAVAHSETMVQFLDSSTGQELATFDPPDPWNINWLGFSPDGAYFAVTCGKYGTQLWDLAKIRSELAAMNLDWDLPSLPAMSDPTATGRSPKPPDPRNSQLTELRPVAAGADGL